MSRSPARPVFVGLTAAVLVLGACNRDDGASVRDLGGSSSESDSGSAIGSSSGSGTGSQTAPECEPVGDIESADEVVPVELSEWAIDVAPTLPAGNIGFEVTNVGSEAHEMVVIKGVAAADLPLDADGALDEFRLPSGALVGEIEAFPSGEACTGVFELEPGDYTFVCNLVETESDGAVESHLHEGMIRSVTVG